MNTVLQKLTGNTRRKNLKLESEREQQHRPTLRLQTQDPHSHSPLTPFTPTHQLVSQPQDTGTDMNWVGGFAQPTIAPVPVTPLNTQDDDSEHLVWFAAIDQDNSGRISAEELQSALMTGNGGKRFSSDTVKYLMNVFDLDGNGEIGVEEFKPLWNYVKQWREMYDSFDDNNDGIIDARELATALSHYGMHVGPFVIDMLIRKYGTYHHSSGHKTNTSDSSPKIELDRFVCACVVVQQLCHLYDRCGAIQAGVRRDEFLLAVLRLP